MSAVWTGTGVKLVGQPVFLCLCKDRLDLVLLAMALEVACVAVLESIQHPFTPCKNVVAVCSSKF